MQMLFVLLVATFAEAEVVTSNAIEAELPTLNGLLATITSKPGFILLLKLLFNSLLNGLDKLSCELFIINCCSFGMTIVL